MGLMTEMSNAVVGRNTRRRSLSSWFSMNGLTDAVCEYAAILTQRLSSAWKLFGTVALLSGRVSGFT